MSPEDKASKAALDRLNGGLDPKAQLFELCTIPPEHVLCIVCCAHSPEPLVHKPKCPYKDVTSPQG